MRLPASILVLGVLALTARGQSPVAVVTNTGEALLRRDGRELPVKLLTGDLLFPGDAIDVQQGAVDIAHCPTRTQLVANANAQISFTGNSDLRLRGAVQRTPLNDCALPLIDRAAFERVEFHGRARGGPGGAAAIAVAASAPELLARAHQLEQQRNWPAARDTYQQLAQVWPQVDWPRKLVHWQEEQIRRQEAAQRSSSGGAGRTFALLVGISDYARLRREEQLQYASADATSLARFFQSPRGGALPPEQLRVLTNSAATTAALRNAFQGFLRDQAGKQDTIFIFLAAHGIFDQRGAYVITHDTDPEDLAATALPMAEIQNLIEQEFAHVGRVFLFVDICRAGTIGAIAGNKINSAVEVLLRLRSTESFVLLSSGPKQYSFESERFGGGHGAFSYFLMRGLNGDADADRDGKVRSGELAEYVRSSVRQATRGRQTPRESGTMDADAVLIDRLDQPGIAVKDWTPLDSGSPQARNLAERRAQEELRVSFRVLNRREQDTLTEFEEAVAQGRILPETAGSAFSVWSRYRRDLAAADRVSDFLENRLRVALQDRGQSVLLKYLQGDAVPQTRQDFDSGELFFEATLTLDPQAEALQSRALFCRARRLLFEKRVKEAIPLLERAARIDPNGAYIYNALGLGYLELAEYAPAAAAFRDAIRLSPRWVYPRHNLALTLTELGDYTAAESAYLEARRLAPRAFFLCYNQGLLYQRSNRCRDAVRLLEEADTLEPGRPEVPNALGLVEAALARSKPAEAHYREALRRNPDFGFARHNLALLLAADRARRAEAIAIWRELLTREPALTTARAALAETLAAAGQWPEAQRQYELLLEQRPNSISGRLALAEGHLRAGNWTGAEQVLRAAGAAFADHPLVIEKWADIHAAAGRRDEAQRGYESLRRLAADPELRKRVQQKLKALTNAVARL